MVTVVHSSFAVADSCGIPLTIVDAQNTSTAVALATGSVRIKAPNESARNWVVVKVTPEQRAKVESLPAESVVSYLLTLPEASWYS